MSEIGKWLLENCDNNLSIDIRLFNPEFTKKGWTYMTIKLTALCIGVTVKPDS